MFKVDVNEKNRLQESERVKKQDSYDTALNWVYSILFLGFIVIGVLTAVQV